MKKINTYLIFIILSSSHLSSVDEVVGADC